MTTNRFRATARPNVVAYHEYRPFGWELTNPDLDDEVMRFSGHERDTNYSDPTLDSDENDDLDYMHARYYTPYFRRFLSPDEKLGSPELPQSWNRYAYVRNSPLTHVDPTGQEAAVAIRQDQRLLAVAKGEMTTDEFLEVSAAEAAGAAAGLGLHFGATTIRAAGPFVKRQAIRGARQARIKAGRAARTLKKRFNERAEKILAGGSLGAAFGGLQINSDDSVGEMSLKVFVGLVSGATGAFLKPKEGLLSGLGTLFAAGAGPAALARLIDKLFDSGEGSDETGNTASPSSPSHRPPDCPAATGDDASGGRDCQ